MIRTRPVFKFHSFSNFQCSGFFLYSYICSRVTWAGLSVCLSGVTSIHLGCSLDGFWLLVGDYVFCNGQM